MYLMVFIVEQHETETKGAVLSSRLFNGAQGSVSVF